MTSLGYWVLFSRSPVRIGLSTALAAAKPAFRELFFRALPRHAPCAEPSSSPHLLPCSDQVSPDPTEDSSRRRPVAGRRGI
jgi:hypothetical protein